MHIKFEKFLESKKNTLDNILKDYVKVDNYGTIIIKDTNDKLKKLKKELEENYKSEFDKIKIVDDELIIYKNNIKYDCIMLSSNISDKDWNNFLEMFDEKDLYLGETQTDIDNDEFGLEKKPHVTLLYGLHPKENDKKEIFKWLESLKPIELSLSKIGIFENEKYDVVKIDIKPTKQLLEYREYSEKIFKNTQTFSDFHPHMTLAYVLPGKGEKYIQTLKNKLNLIFDTAVYSDSNYKKNYIKFNDN